MKLSEFVSNTVNELCEAYRKIGVEQGEYKDGVELNRKVYTEIRFDIMVTSQETGNTGGSGGINVYDVVKIGGKKEVSATNENVNRIQFEMSMVPPRPPQA